jgi:non-specific serine/threonine protein kinase
VITTYGSLARLPWLAETRWRLLILDEAQAIKNPTAQQTRTVKAIDAGTRLALTGTPVENRLGDLWSLFDFLNPGLLGSARDFAALTRGLGNGGPGYGPLRRLVRPYVLRRLKTDAGVAADLPDKTELRAYCGLSPRQAALYEHAVENLASALRAADGMRRRGVILAALVRLKQICNHPAHWQGSGPWTPGDSGKLARLDELCEPIALRREKVLVFTQFREATAPLAAHLAARFGRPGVVLHGDTPVAERSRLVERFQSEDDLPFFVLSVKAGGTGLNLTAAAHVVHFDRWWNPAVEDQATDRAFRIGQRRNVLVHKFVCRGTVEERIDAIIEGKRALSRELGLDAAGGGAGEALLTEMGDRELLELVSLDIARAFGDA